MASVVYYGDMRAQKGNSLPEKLERLCERLSFFKNIQAGELVAITVHFGERGGSSFVRPLFLRRLVEKVKQAGGRPFLTDSNTLYKGGRRDAVAHIQTAIENGFSYATLEAPIIIADGLTGFEQVEIDVNLKHFEKVKISSTIYWADSLLSVAHAKGHVLYGFAGTLKKVGMGLGSRAGKQLMHADMVPLIDPQVCQGCGICAQWCPMEAITLLETEGKRLAQVDLERCQGCAECLAACLKDAVKVSWEGSAQSVQEKTVEYFYGAVKDKKGKVGYINFAMDICPHCDCFSRSDASIVPDVGILASDDPVALDQATVDLINEQPTIANSDIEPSKRDMADKFRALYPEVDWTWQLRYAEELGLGQRTYRIERV